MPRARLSNPLCLRCKTAPAKMLLHGGDNIFCTMRCAADYGAACASEEMEWCGQHHEWFIAVDGCTDGCTEDHDEEEEDDDEEAA